ALLRVLRLNPSSGAITAFLGFVPTALFAGIWALFAPLNSLFFSVFAVLQLFLLASQRYAFWSYSRRLVLAFASMKPMLRIWFTGTTLLLVYAASGGGLLPDNETYY